MSNINKTNLQQMIVIFIFHQDDEMDDLKQNIMGLFA